MIDAIGISGTTPFSPARSSVQRAPSPEAPSRINIAESLNSTRIRVDNFLDLAIIEVRSNETGDIIRQYPTEMQIKSFQRATELQQRSGDVQQESSQVARVETPEQSITPSTNSPASVETGYSPTTLTVSATPAPTTSGETSTQSVVV